VSAISDFKVNSRVVHFVYGGGRVILRDKENVGILWDTGFRGAYGVSYWDCWPDLIKLDEPAAEAREPPDALSIEDRIHLDVTGHLPEDF